MLCFCRSFRSGVFCILGLISLSTYAADLTVSWTDNSSAETGFEIERSGDGVTFTTVASVGANVTSYVDRNLPSDAGYWYRIRAYNDSGARSAYSNIGGMFAGSPRFGRSRSRLSNLSARTIPGADDRSFIVGFVVGGGAKSGP